MSILCLVMHVLCVYALKLLSIFLGARSGFLWWGQVGSPAKKRADLALFKKPEIFENYLGIPAYNQRAAGPQPGFKVWWEKYFFREAIFLFSLYVFIKNALGTTKFMGYKINLGWHCPPVPPIAMGLTCCRWTTQHLSWLLTNILRNEKTLRSVASLLEGSDWRRQRQGNDQEVEEGFSNF